jgi:desulfoferrodoxin-like iron-binding protein
MMEVGEVYCCVMCGTEVGILKAGKGVLSCCEKPMVKNNND